MASTHQTTDHPPSNANASAKIKNSFTNRKRQRVVKLTVLSLTDIRVRVPPSNSSVEQLTVGEGGAYHLCQEKRPAETVSNVGSVSPLPQHLQPFLEKVGLGLNGTGGTSNVASSEEMRQSQINPNQRGNLSLSAAVSFSGSCPPQHMHVLSPALCSKTGRMIVESDPVLRHGEDVADHSIHSATHEVDGTIAHVLVAKWDGADAYTDDSITGDGQRNDISDIETAGTGGAMSTESSKSEHWRRRRETTFRRMGSGSNMSQPHMTVKLHRSAASDDGDGSTKVYSCHSVRDSMSPLKLPPFHNVRVAKEEEFQQPQQGGEEEEAQRTRESEGTNGDANIFRMDGGGSLPSVLRVPSPLPSPTSTKDSRPTSPALGDFAMSTKPSPPVSTNLPDIIELNVALLVGRDLASNVDGDSGGILQPHDNSVSLEPIGGIAHLVLFPKDMPDGGSSILELPVRKRSQGAANNAAPKASNSRHLLVELGDNALLRVRIEIDPPKSDLALRDDAANDSSAIQWTLSGASAAVRAGTEEADGEEVSMAKLADNDQDATASDLLASDGATGRRGMDTRRVPGAFCAGLSDITDMWGAFAKKCVLHCVDNCDDDALVYVNDGDGGDSLGSTINTVYENIMY
mmetsp:Transcript_2260/g.6585  ORF Transcript_2260/g.6585 Transcript_2260/m.6585 type:complete len:630 (+) Transcript_2260:322-2211(+)|eukprot:CAMPEP_0181028974 /NCGR_PEP_ID=MMETSP1070-20121207/4952_1 /TAXON_ID=265543 /ORGANISM="Minutocellus polymorphus, Strain NH13" /LENGTH=629 /DNA_ID=CAMNT_0023106255 /DNA_START=230 /DNA_END=2119 /DNA_ORIENTATION=+